MIQFATLYRLLIAFLLILNAVSGDMYAADCDEIKHCFGRALTFSVNSGRGAHYVDVDQSPALSSLSQAMTFECWLKVEEQPGQRQFIAGLWGPRQDDNDVWVVYISENDELVFEVNGDGTKLGQEDNTVVRTSAAPLYGNRWVHIAAVFDGTQERGWLYIDGQQVATARNALYPTRYLRPLERRDLLTQIGSCNALTDNATLFRTLRGQIDEIRIWNVAVPQFTLDCRSRLSLEGNEAGLALYYRCNEETNQINLCDATDNGATGRMRNGAACRNQTPQRSFRQTVVFTPLQWPERLDCDSTMLFTFQIVDTSACGSSVRIGLSGTDRGLYRVVEPRGLVRLNPNQPVIGIVEVNVSAVGQFRANIDINNANRCGSQIRRPANFVRSTELQVSTNRIVFDTLYVGCRDTRFFEDTITLCNNTAELGTPRTVTVSGFRTGNSDAFQVLADVPLPIRLAPGECRPIRVRMNLLDTAAEYSDTLYIESDDRCPGIASVILEGTVVDVLSITRTNGEMRLDSMRFDTTCVGLISSPESYLWRNVSGRPIVIDSIRLPEGFIGTRMQLPRTLEPDRGYPENVIRFRPGRQGVFEDSVIFYTSIQGCLIEKKLYVSGRGYAPEVLLSDGSLDLGDVLVGQTAERNFTATNIGQDTIRTSFFLKIGEQLRITGARGFLLNIGETRGTRILFRPPHAGVFEDTICLFEQRCFTTICIPIRGRGIEEVFDYQPDILEIRNVLACSERQDTLRIQNVSGVSQVLSEIELIDPNEKFAIVAPNPLPEQMNIEPNGSVEFVVRFRPDDLNTERADRAFIRYRTGDGRRWEGQLYGTSALTRIGVSDNVQYGIVEVGDEQEAEVRVENLSSFDVQLSEIRLPAGFRFAVAPSLPQVLTPRQALTLRVVFAPEEKRRYTGDIEVLTDAPCAVIGRGRLEGQGEVYELDAPLQLITWGFTRPCDCIVRDLPLVNRSSVFPMIVNDIRISREGIPDELAGERLFSWRSALAPAGDLPITIPPGQRDTVFIEFCPQAPSVRAWIPNAARLHIDAEGSGWEASYSVFLSGQRALMFEADRRRTIFAPAPVDTLAPPRFFELEIPEVLVNPFQSDIVIDSITFLPDERVFFASAADGSPFPLRIAPGEPLELQFDCRPRSPRVYEARVVLHMSEPCPDIDTTLQIEGSGFAPAFGLQFSFDNNRITTDTFAINSCDTLVVPIYTTREIPADVVDISMRLRYDTDILDFLDAESIYTTPQVTTSATAAGVDVLLPSCRGVDSLSPMTVLRFVPRTNATVEFGMVVDSIFFDTEEVMFYNIVAGNDNAVVRVFKTELTVVGGVDFDSVRILECVDREVLVENTGDVELRVGDLSEQFPGVSFAGGVPPDVLLQPGERTGVVLRFCPLDNVEFNTTANIFAVEPCRTLDSFVISGVGYAPPFPVSFSIVPPFGEVNTISAPIGQEVSFTLEASRDFAADYQQRYWLEDLEFVVQVQYNPRALRYISSQKRHQYGEMRAEVPQPGVLNFRWSGVDTLREGALADVQFLATVPDREVSEIEVNAGEFATGGVMFLDIQPQTEIDNFMSLERCRLSSLIFGDEHAPELSEAIPNPARNNVAFNFRLQETVPVILEVYSVEGKKVKTLLDGSQTIRGGAYKVEFDCADLAPGVYFVVMEGGVFRATRKMVIVR